MSALFFLLFLSIHAVFAFARKEGFYILTDNGETTLARFYGCPSGMRS